MCTWGSDGHDDRSQPEPGLTPSLSLDTSSVVLASLGSFHDSNSIPREARRGSGQSLE